MKRTPGFALLTLCLVGLVACTPADSPTATVAVPTDNPVADMPNPASAYCVEQGYKSEIRTASDGSQSGVCIFPDGTECDEWAFFRGECGQVPAPPAPNFVDEPLQMIAASVPLPFAVLVNTGDQRGITAYDRSGLALGEWQTNPWTGRVHTSGPITEGIQSTPLVFWSWETERSLNTLTFNLGGVITPLFSISDPPTMLTGMTGVPASPLIAYSTLQYEKTAGLVRSRLMLDDYQSLTSAAPILVIDSSNSEYITPLAIRVENGEPAGIWFTWHMIGIGGTPALFTNNSGLYYFDISANTVYTFLAAGKKLTDLSPNQACAAWVNTETGEMQLTDLINGGTVSFPKLPESELNAGHGVISPSCTTIAWEEGIDLVPGGSPVYTVRIAAVDGTMIAEFLHSNFAKTSGLGMETSIKLLGWLSDEILLVGVDQLGKDGKSVIVAVNVNANDVTFFTGGEFAGFAYP